MPQADDDADEMRLDELAHRSGVPSTTIRLYQSKDLLPGPRLVGRVGWYDRRHLARLRLINRLQDEGFSLAGIGRILDSWETGRGLADLVGVEEQLDALLSRRYAVTLSLDDLAKRLPPEALTPEAMRRAAEAGLVVMTDDGRVQVPDVRFLDSGAALVEMGVPVDVVLDQWEHLTTVTDDLASRFVTLFEDHLVPDTLDDGLDDGQIDVMTANLARLRDLAGQVVGSALDASIARVGAQRLGSLSPPPGRRSTRRGRRRAAGPP